MNGIPESKDRFSFLIGLVVGFVIAAMLSSVMAWYTFHGKVVAKVNNQPIRLGELIETLLKVHGWEALDFLVEKELIKNEAKRLGLEVNTEEIQAGVKEIMKTYPSKKEFEQVLKQKRSSVKDLEEQVSLHLLTKKLVATTVEEKDLREFYKRFKSFEYEDQPYDKVKDRVRRDYEEVTLSQSIVEKIIHLKEKAHIIYYW